MNDERKSTAKPAVSGPEARRVGKEDGPTGEKRVTAASVRAGGSGRTEPARTLDEAARAVESTQGKLQQLADRLDRIERLVPSVEEELRRGLYEVQDAIAAHGFIPDDELSYKLMVRRVRNIVDETLPSDSSIAVVARPDREFLNIHGRKAFCLPQNRDGEYTGYYPGSDTAALAQLEAVRAKGAEYLVVPETSKWWLQHYRNLKRHLDRRYRLLADEADACAIFDLRRSSGTGNFRNEIERVLSLFEFHYGRTPSILDWDTGLNLGLEFTEEAVFTTKGSEGRLPYLESSVDIVAYRSEPRDRSEEAARVAAAAVVAVHPGSEDTGNPSLAITWMDAAPVSSIRTCSIVIPCFNNIERTAACLDALGETLPDSFRGEIIVLDDCSSDGTPDRLRERQSEDDRLKVIRHSSNQGFVASCNTAARAATGEMLIFLNNDTLPLPGWLPALLRVFRDYPDAGAAGGRLVYPEGKLQEAGGVVFRDGTAANFGRGDYNPDHPMFCYLREVDYCSGALLATKRETFEKLGGFDQNYSPAYYEDTDYCFRVREQGLKVYYQPESTVIHYEGATAGMDLSAGTKRYQAINEVKFLKRWRETLETQPERPGEFNFETHHALELRGSREEGPGRRRALVCALLPEFDRDSGSRRVLHLVESLQKAGWLVTFVSHHDNPNPRYVRNLQRRGVAVYAGDKLWIEPLIATGVYDLAVFGLWDIAEPHVPLIRSISPETRVLVDSIDLHFLRNARRSFAEASPDGVVTGLDANYGSEMIRELNTYAATDATLTVSAKEAGLINDLVGERSLAHTVPDGEDPSPESMPIEDRKGLVFVGCFRHLPNAHAVEYLCKEVLPKMDPDLLARHPAYIVGEGMNDNVRSLAADLPNVHMVGWVPSVVPYLRRARVSVVPLLYGAGTKRKLVEALLYGTPSVATSVGTEGLDVVDGRHVLVADDPETFAASVTRLLVDDEEWRRLEREGREHMLARHGREKASERLADVVESVFARQTRKPQRPPAKPAPDEEPGKREAYRELVGRIRRAVDETVANDASVAVVSKGDNALLDLGPRRTWHFPQDEQGRYAGYHPRDSQHAIDNLKILERAGADHVLVPSSYSWWLEHYAGLKDYLDSHYDLLLEYRDTCFIFGRSNGSAAGRGGGRWTGGTTVGSESTPSKPERAPRSGRPVCTADVRLIAFFLPQYHPIPENDGWWGKGFTEWQSVTAARPIFPGHYQPRLPADLGYYDLRLPEVREAQARLAETYGIHGFCYYHYWFGGKQLLELPFDEVLKTGRPDLPFCLCWANEPWTRRWDGQPRDVLQAQTYGPEDDLAHIQWLLPALADPRAIRIEGRPVLIVYQARDLPSPARTTELWRAEAQRSGLGDLYLMTIETGWDAGWDATREGFDAKILFQPQFASLFNSKTEIDLGNKGKPRVFAYDRAWPVLANPEPVGYRRYDTVCTSWDNSARRGNDAVILHGSTPEAYEGWLRHAISRTEGYPDSERVVFINAWNEWAEGCHLEPDRRNGLSYLEATARALVSSSVSRFQGIPGL